MDGFSLLPFIWIEGDGHPFVLYRQILFVGRCKHLSFRQKRKGQGRLAHHPLLLMRLRQRIGWWGKGEWITNQAQRRLVLSTFLRDECFVPAVPCEWRRKWKAGAEEVAGRRGWFELLKDGPRIAERRQLWMLCAQPEGEQRRQAVGEVTCCVR